jgi:hypothetical protein
LESGARAIIFARMNKLILCAALAAFAAPTPALAGA